MHSKNLPPLRPRLSLRKVEHGLDKEKLKAFAFDLARELKPGSKVLLTGEMGAGKTTLAKMLLELLGVEQIPEGSPTYPIAHEYDSKHGKIIHCDFYRLKSEVEIVEAGLEEYFFGSRVIIISEWVSKFPSFESEVTENSRRGQLYKITLTQSENQPDLRDVVIETNEETH